MTGNNQDNSVLMIENDAPLLETTVDYLSRAGYAVQSASNGWDAIKQLQQGATDIVVFELDLADSDGSGMREKLLLHPATRDIPFLYLVPEGASHRQVRGLRDGVDDYVMKPFDPIALVARVQATIERRRVYEEMIRVDPLTRVLNRRTFENELANELERVRRYGRFGSLVLINLDNFASINTEQGQAMGDLLLTCLSGIIMTHMRTIDIAGRHQGEEFALYLPETQGAGAFTLTDRIHERFRRNADTMTGLEVTFSAGIVVAPRDGDESKVLCEHAAEVVQQAKKAGKARILLRTTEAG